MTRFILTLGFNTSALTKCLVREDINEGDTVVILRPSGEKDNRGEQAVKDIGDFLSKMGDIELEVIKLHPATPYKSAVKIINILRTTNQKQVVGITGGGRELVLPIMISIITMADEIDDFYAFSDVDKRLRKFKTANFIYQPDKKDLAILKKTEKDKKIKELSEDLDLSQSTISRRCSKLTENRLLEYEKRSKNKIFKRTSPGEIVLKIHESDLSSM